MKTSSCSLTLAAALLALFTACGGPADAGLPADPVAPGGPAGPADPPPAPPTDPAIPTGPAPSITVLNRLGSPPAGGTMVLILGNNLATADQVTFGGEPATGLTYDAANSWLQVVTPPHAEGFVDVVVHLPDGQAATEAGFHYGPPPVVTGMTPATGHRDDVVTITGENFADVHGVSVSFAGTHALITQRSATQLVVIVPKMNPGTYQVVVANFDDQFALAPVPFVMQ